MSNKFRGLFRMKFIWYFVLNNIYFTFFQIKYVRSSRAKLSNV